jgi:hypothetical protein
MLRILYPALSVGLALGATLTARAALADGRDHDRDDRQPRRAVPEISAKHAGAALALVIGGTAVVLGRRRRKVA